LSDDAVQESEVYHSVISGEWVELEGSSESARRSKAAMQLDCDSSDIRRGYDHSGREADDETAVLAENLIREALRGDDDGR